MELTLEEFLNLHFQLNVDKYELTIHVDSFDLFQKSKFYHTWTTVDVRDKVVEIEKAFIVKSDNEGLVIPFGDKVRFSLEQINNNVKVKLQYLSTTGVSRKVRTLFIDTFKVNDAIVNILDRFERKLYEDASLYSDLKLPYLRRIIFVQRPGKTYVKSFSRKEGEVFIDCESMPSNFNSCRIILYDDLSYELMEVEHLPTLDKVKEFLKAVLSTYSNYFKFVEERYREFYYMLRFFDTFLKVMKLKLCVGNVFYIPKNRDSITSIILDEYEVEAYKDELHIMTTGGINVNVTAAETSPCTINYFGRDVKLDPFEKLVEKFTHIKQAVVLP